MMLITKKLVFSICCTLTIGYLSAFDWLLTLRIKMTIYKLDYKV